MEVPRKGENLDNWPYSRDPQFVLDGSNIQHIVSFWLLCTLFPGSEAQAFQVKRFIPSNPTSKAQFIEVNSEVNSATSICSSFKHFFRRTYLTKYVRFPLRQSGKD